MPSDRLFLKLVSNRLSWPLKLIGKTVEHGRELPGLSKYIYISIYTAFDIYGAVWVLRSDVSNVAALENNKVELPLESGV